LYAMMWQRSASTAPTSNHMGVDLFTVQYRSGSSCPVVMYGALSIDVHSLCRETGHRTWQLHMHSHTSKAQRCLPLFSSHTTSAASRCLLRLLPLLAWL
jgi:hypothetical protein